MCNNIDMKLHLRFPVFERVDTIIEETFCFELGNSVVNKSAHLLFSTTTLGLVSHQGKTCDVRLPYIPCCTTFDVEPKPSEIENINYPISMKSFSLCPIYTYNSFLV
uniref:Putative ovule protein n=1 Tax=Solanum chacoense TaxID=4108 RepID=A0A0V0H1A9_SOLCH